MKKLVLILGLIISTQIETKAQHENQSTDVAGYSASKHTALQKNDSFLKSIYSTTGNGTDKHHDFYQRRSKTYRIVGWSTLGGGIILGVAGILVASNDVTYTDYTDELRAGRTIRALFISSAAAGIVSIPFMIMASAYKQKARLELKNEKTGFGVPPNVSKDITGITITIPIGK